MSLKMLKIQAKRSRSDQCSWPYGRGYSVVEFGCDADNSGVARRALVEFATALFLSRIGG